MKYLFLLLISFSVYAEVGIPVLEDYVEETIELIEAEILPEENEQKSSVSYTVYCEFIGEETKGFQKRSSYEHIEGAQKHLEEFGDNNCYIKDEEE